MNSARTSDGMFFNRGENPLCERIERRLAAMVRWPYENGEGLQVLRYRHGAQYVPHYDYFDPAQPGTPRILQRGGQRVGTIVMYLRTPGVVAQRSSPMMSASKSRRSRVQRCSSAMTARIPIRRRCTAARQSHWAKIRRDQTWMREGEFV